MNFQEIGIKKTYPYFSFNSFINGSFDLGVHWRENILVGDRAIKDLFDGCMT